MSQKNVVYVTKIIGLPLISGIMLLWLASIYRQMLTLGSRRSDCSFLNLAIFMKKFEFSCQSLELISRIAQPVCLNNIEEDAAFLYPTNCCLIREKVVTFRMVKLNMLLSIFLITK